MHVRAEDVVWKFAPNARPEYEKAFSAGHALLDEYDVDTPTRLAHFMAQIFHESGGLRISVESGLYSEKALARMWDGGNWHKYFASRADCLAMAQKCAVDKGKALFSLVYGGRMGNGAAETGDGWTYRGRGLMQTTGREAYTKYGKRWSADFVGNPDLVFSAEHALKPALSEWKDNDLNKYADAGDIRTITVRINGGTVGLEERKAWFYRIFPFVQGGVSEAWRVQGELYKLGFLADRPDGIVGGNTRGAITAYRQQKGLGAGTAIDAELRGALGLGA